MTPLVPATEYLELSSRLTEFSDKKLEFFYDRMVQLNKDIMKTPEFVLIAQDELCGIVVRSQYWGRKAYEELVRRDIPIVQHFMWNNKGELYGNTEKSSGKV